MSFLPTLPIGDYELSQTFLPPKRSSHLIDGLSTNKLVISNKSKKKIVMVILGGFLIYRVLWTSFLHQECLRDLTHTFTSAINDKINQKNYFYYYFVVGGQLLIDLQMVLFIWFQMFKVKNFFLCVFIALFYGIRAIFLNIEKFPYPNGIYWKQPQFPPSLGVPYGITRDFFYSGHTGLMLFSCQFWSLKKETRFFKYISWFGLGYIILLVLSTRVHYFIDVFAAVFFSLWISNFSRNNLEFFDTIFTKVYLFFSLIFSLIFQFLEIIYNRLKRSRESKNQKNPIQLN